MEIIVWNFLHFLILRFSILSISNKSVLRLGKTAHISYLIFCSFQEKYLCSLKSEVSPVVLHIITLHSSNYWLRYLWSIFMLDNIKININANLWIFQFSTVNCKLWLCISQSINRAVEIGYMQNDQADLNFQSK